MDNFMVLGAGTLQIPLIKKVNELGYSSVVVSPDPNEPGFEFAAIKVYADVADEEKVFEYAKEYNITGIITDQTDIAVRSVAYVAEKLNLPGIGHKTAHLFTDKYLMRERCKELGIKTLEYELTTSLEEALEFYEKLKKPVILKPVDNQGSRGVYRVATIDELIAKYEEAISYSKSHKVLIEEYVEGRQFVVDGLAFDGHFENLIIGDALYFDIPDVFSCTRCVYPSSADPNLVKRLGDLNKKIITGFGLNQGRTHSEFIMNGDDIILVETAARGGGVYISSDLVFLSTNFSTEEFLIQIATGNLKKFPEFKTNLRSCCYVAFYLPVGEIVSADCIKEVLDLPYTHRHNFAAIKPGVKTKPYTDKTARFFIIIDAENRKQLDERTEHIRNILNGINVKTINGIKTPIWE